MKNMPLAIMITIAIYLIAGKEYAGLYLLLACLVRLIKHNIRSKNE